MFLRLDDDDDDGEDDDAAAAAAAAVSSNSADVEWKSERFYNCSPSFYSTAYPPLFCLSASNKEAKKSQSKNRVIVHAERKSCNTWLCAFTW